MFEIETATFLAFHPVWTKKTTAPERIHARFDTHSYVPWEILFASSYDRDRDYPNVNTRYCYSSGSRKTELCFVSHGHRYARTENPADAEGWREWLVYYILRGAVVPRSG